LLTDEQWRLVEKYQHVPTWLVMKRLGKDSSLIRCALIRFGTTDDLIADLKFAVIKAIRSYDPSFGASIKTWVVRVCFQNILQFSRIRKRDKLAWHQLDRDLEAKEEPEKIQIPLHLLTKKEHDIIYRRFYKKETLAQVGKRYKVSKERIRQLQKEALGKMREYYEATKMDDSR